MSRVKTFDSTGLATAGRLYAGDLNQIQDQYADLVNYSQTHGVSLLAVGDSTLQLLKYGAGEMRLTGHVRTDGILRGLGGLYGGQFTTTTRDAIAAGLAPYGLIVFNTTTNRYEWNKGSDGARNWQPLGAESVIDTYANRPSAAAISAGGRFFATDQIAEYVSTGAAWVRVTVAAGTVFPWLSNTIPAGHVLLDGSVLPSSSGIYTDIFAVLGTTTLPNWKGRAVVGRDAAQTEFDTILEQGGFKTHTLTIAEIPPHLHDILIFVFNYGGTGSSGQAFNGTPLIDNGVDTGLTGGGGAHNNLQPYAVANWIAKL